MYPLVFKFVLGFREPPQSIERPRVFIDKSRLKSGMTPVETKGRMFDYAGHFRGGLTRRQDSLHVTGLRIARPLWTLSPRFDASISPDIGG
jgi:hypothetical protein